MEFSTEIVAKMAEMVAAELIEVVGPVEPIVRMEEGMWELLYQVGKQALGS